MVGFHTPDVEVPAQATICFGGPAQDGPETVQKRNNSYYVYIDTREGQRSIARLDLNDNELTCYGDTRTHEYLTLKLSATAAQNLADELESAFDFEEVE